MNKKLTSMALFAAPLIGTALWSSNTMAVNVGYYEMCNGAGQAWQVPPITTAGQTPVLLNDLTAADMTGVDVIFITNCNNFAYDAEFTSRLGDIHAAVNSGKVLVIHDRYVDPAESILPGGGGFTILRNFADATNTNVVDTTTLVTNGPGGSVDNLSLDGGNLSHHGYALSGSLPATSKRILSRANANEIVTFSYAYGSGQVIYSTIPLDYYLQGFGPAGVSSNFRNTYTPNVIAYAATLLSINPLANAGPDQSIAEGASVQLDGSGSSDPQNEVLSYAWTQLAGPTVTLSNTTVANPSFAAPYVASNQTLTFQLVVTDASGHLSLPDTVDIGVQQYNNPPIADAGNDGTIKEGARKYLDGNLSYDSDAGDAITSHHWVQTAGTAVTLEPNASLVNPSFLAPVGNPGEMLTFALTVSDGKETSTADSVNVSVVANSAPVANAGSDDSRNENTLVSLNGGASSDPDGDGISYGWTQLTGPLVALNNATTATPSFTTPWVGPGGVPLTFKLTVNDDDPVNPKSHSDTVVINVLNINDPPNCSLAQPSVSVLWPPNHGLVPVMINNVADPNGNSTLTISSVTQDEPINGLGDGDTTPDAIVQHGNTADSVLLRAERSGKADGRVYRVNFTATDAEGSCSGFVTVSAPHDRNKAAIDNGQTTTSTQP